MPTTTRPTRLSEWTIVGTLAALCLLGLIFGAILTFPSWPDAVAGLRIHYLGWALILSVVGILLLVVAMASPWIGSVRIAGMGAEISVHGEADATPSGPDAGAPQ